MEMDQPTRSIVDFVRSVEFDSLTPQIVHAVVRNYLDAVGCAAAGINGQSTIIARKLAANSSGVPAASAYGLSKPTLLELAVLANSIATRYQDWDDGGLHGHPADMSPAIVAMAETNGASGKDVVSALYVAYETMKSVGDAIPPKGQVWDQGFYISISVAAGLAKVLRLTDDQLANAIAIAVSPSIPLRAARTGQLSHWKSVASAHAAMTGTFAARLAQAGMTGPPHVFDGTGGVFENVTGPFELDQIGSQARRKSGPELVHHKPYPSYLNSQGPIDQMLRLRTGFAIEDVESITLSIYQSDLRIGGSVKRDLAEKKDPKTRESADHSLFFLLARALVDGSIDSDTYSDERINDPTLRPLMHLISVSEGERHPTSRKPDNLNYSLLEVNLKDGRVLRDELVGVPRGNPKNPMTDEELGKKFDVSIGKVLPPVEQAELRERLWSLPDEEDLSHVTSLFRKFS